MRGGYREGSGRSKSGYYNGIYCGSTYELCWVIYNIDHAIPFARFNKKLTLNGISYFPDFILSDGKTIIETKGYELQESVDKKTEVAEYFGYTVIVLRKVDLKYAFDYVKLTYNTSNYQSLYDGYKPKYSLLCKNCNSLFYRDKQPKTDNVFCNRICAGKYRKKIINVDRNIEKSKYTRVFTKYEALQIYNDSDTLQKIANKYNVTKNTIWFIKNKSTYKWIHD